MQEFQLENLIRNNIFQFCKPFVAKIEDALNEILQIKQVISDIKVKCEGTDDNIAQLEHLMYYIMFIRNQKDIIVENIGQKCIKIEDYCTSTISKNLSDILSLKLEFQNIQLEQTDQNEYIGALQNLSRGMTERIEMQNNSTLKMINKLQSDTQEFRIQQQQENEQVQQQVSKNNYEIFQQQQSINQVLQLSEQIIEFKHQVDSKIGWIEGSQKEIVQSYQQFMTRTEFQYEVNQLENTIKLLQKQVKQIESEQDTQQSQPQIKIHNLSPATPMFQQITQLNSSDITSKELDKITQEIDKKIISLRNELTFIINQDQKKLDSDIKQMSKQIELIQLKIKDQTQYCRTGFEKSKTNSSELQSFKNSYQQQMNALKQDIQNALEQQLLQQVENQIQKSLSSTMKGSFSVPTTSKLLQDQTKSDEPLLECNYLEQQIIQSDVLIKYIKGICSEVKTNQPQTTDFEIQDSDSSQKVDNIKPQIQNKSTNDKDMYKMHAEIVKIKSDIQNHQEYFQSQIKQLFKYKSLQDDTVQRLSKKTLYQQEQLNVSLAILLQNEMSLYQYVNILQIQPPSKLKNQELGFELDFDPNLQDDIIFGGNKLGKIEVIHRVLKLSSTNKLKKQQQKDDNEELKKQTTFKPYENQYNQLQQLQPPQRSRKKMSFQNPPKQKRNNFSIDLQQMPNQDTDKVPPSLQDKIDQVNQSLDFSYRKLPYSTRQQVLIKYKKLN